MTKAEAAQLRADLMVLYRHVAEDRRRDYLIANQQPTTLRILAKALPPVDRPFDAENHVALEKVVSWVRFAMRWNADDLTPDERRVSEVAERVAAALPRDESASDAGLMRRRYGSPADSKRPH